MEQVVKIIAIKQVTHDVKHYQVEKPAGYQFEPGQATEVSINLPEWKEERRPFTFTSLNDWPYLEFTIKSYRDHDGVTDALDKLQPGDELIVRDVWGAITYKGAGYFIAGGAGITPFIAILRQLKEDDKLQGNQLFFSNKTAADVIMHADFAGLLGAEAHFVLTKETGAGYEAGYINKDYLISHITDFSKPFYICGPDKMVAEVTAILQELGASAEQVVFEK